MVTLLPSPAVFKWQNCSAVVVAIIAAIAAIAGHGYVQLLLSFSFISD